MEADRCRDLQPSFAAYAAGLTEELLNERIRLHLGEGCPGCASEIEELMEAFHAVPLGLAVQEFDPEHAADLVVRARSNRQEEAETPILFPETDRLRLWKVLTALSAAAVIASALWGMEHRDEARRLAASAPTGPGPDVRLLERQLDGLSATVEAVADPGTTILDLTGGPPGRAFIDVDSGVLVLSIDPIGPVGAGMGLHVWAGDTWVGGLPPAYAAEGGRVGIRIPDSFPPAGPIFITREKDGVRPETRGEVLLESGERAKGGE